MHNGDVIDTVILQEIAPTPEEIKVVKVHIKTNEFDWSHILRYSHNKNPESHCVLPNGRS